MWIKFRVREYLPYGLLLIPLIMGCMISLCSRDIFIRGNFGIVHFGQNQVHNVVWGFACAIFPLGGCLGTFLATYVAHRIGKKITIILLSVLGIVSLAAYACSYFFDSFSLFVFSRLGQGFVSGGLMNIGLVFMFELLPHQMHRMVSTTIQPLINFGIVISGIFSLDLITQGAWVITLAPLFIFSILCLVVSCLLSESYILRKVPGSQNLNFSSNHNQSLSDTLSYIQNERSEPKQVSVKELLTDRQIVGPLVVTILISIFQQLSGINVVIFYISEFIQGAGFQFVDLGNLIAFIVCYLGSVVFALIIPRTGAKKMMILGFVGMSLSFALAYVIYMVRNIPLITVILLSFFLFWFQAGPGPKPWSVFKETFPNEYQTSAQCVLTFSNWVANFLMAAFFPFVLNSIKFHSVGLFAGVNLIFAVVILFLMVETKGKSHFDIVIEYQIKFSRFC